jgi:Mannosyl-glycoprotein endo-beta-N-acetylglucosaminidase
MPLARAVIVGALVTASLVPAAAGYAQETSTTTTTTSTTTTTAPPSNSPTTGASAGPTTGPSPAPGVPKPDPDAFAALANQVSQNEALLAELSSQVAQAEQRLTQLAADIADTQQKLDAARAEMERLKTIVRERAAYIYQHAHASDDAVVDIQHVQDIAAGKKYAESATQTDGGKIDGLARVSADLDAHRAELDAARAQQQQQKDRLEKARVGLETVTAHQKKLLDEAGAIPVLGDAELTAANMTAWFEARNARYRLAGGMSIGDLVQLYMEEAKAEHVRPELAFAQSIIETGSFGNALDNNYAGIGACDSCQGEPAFPTPRDGVRGQIQLLRNYADPTSRAANLANPPSPTIYGNDPVAAARLYDTFFAKGRTPTWNAMGNGNWATDPGYALKVLTIYFQMVSFAAKHG